MSEYKINWDFISEKEGKGKKTGYVPSLNSGVTIATGFDLKEKDEGFLKALGIKDALIQKLVPFLGISGAEASEVADQLVLSTTEVKNIDIASKKFYARHIADQYEKATNRSFNDLSAAQQTVVASVGFQYGSFDRTPTFWTHVMNDDWEKVENELRNFGDAYSTRRNDEADLLAADKKKIKLAPSKIIKEKEPPLITEKEPIRIMEKEGIKIPEVKDLPEVQVKELKPAPELQKEEPLEITLDVPSTEQIPTASFITDQVDLSLGINERKALATPKLYSDVKDSTFDDIYEFGRSVSKIQADSNDFESLLGDFHEISGINLPHYNDPNPETDGEFYIDKDSMGALDAAKYAWKIKTQSHSKDMEMLGLWKQRKEHTLGKINQYFEENPDKKADWKGEDFYWNQRQERAAEVEHTMALNMQYADTWKDKWGGMLVGGGYAAFHDPAIWATMPLSFGYSTAGSIGLAMLRTAAIEMVIAGVTEVGIQTQVVPYRQSLGQNYTWKDASRIIAGVSLGAGVLAPAVVGLMRGTGVMAKNIEMMAAKWSPALRNKIIGKEFQKLVNKGADPELLFEYMQKQFANLSRNELLMVYESSPNAIKFHTPYKQAADDLKQDLNEKIENPLEDTHQGRKENTDRQIDAWKAIIDDTEPSMSETPKSNVKDETRPVIREQILKPDDIEIDAKTFQFKEGGDEFGVLPILKGVDKWDQDAANVVLVWQNKEGRNFIIDGHQRVALAKRIKAKDPSQDPYLVATIRREVDGWEAVDAMVEGMISNVQRGSANAADVARILMVDPAYISRLRGRIAPSSALWNNALGLRALGKDGFNYWVRQGNISDTLAAEVGRLVEDKGLTVNILQLLEKIDPKNLVQARSIIRDALEATTVTETKDLFGTKFYKESLFAERAAVLSRTLNEIKKDKSVMATLIGQEERIIKSGKNKLDTKYNQRRLEENAILIHKIEKLATRKGELSTQLTAAANLWKAGRKQEAIRSFKEAATEAARKGDLDGVDTVGVERSSVSEGYSGKLQKELDETLETKQLKNFDDPQNTDQSIKNAKNESKALETEIEEELLDIPKFLEKHKRQIETDFKNLKLKEIVTKYSDDDLIRNFELFKNHPEVKAKIEEGFSLEETITRAGGKFSEKWKKDRGWNQIVDDVYGSGAELKNKKIIFYLGMPASGKSTLAKGDAKRLGAIILDADDVKAHPNMADDFKDGIGANAVHRESKAIHAMIIDKALRNGDNIILPLVDSKGKATMQFLEIAKTAGYSTYIKFVEVSENVAQVRNIRRMVQTGRLVPPDYIQQVAKGEAISYNKGKGLVNGYQKISGEGELGKPKKILEQGGDHEILIGGGRILGEGGQEATEEISTTAVNATDRIRSKIFTQEEQEGFKLLAESKIKPDDSFEIDGKPMTAKQLVKDVNDDYNIIDTLKACPGLL